MQTTRKYQQDFILINYIHLSPDYVVLEFSHTDPLPYIHPGQFVQVEVESSLSSYLRVPISVYDVDYEENKLSLLVQIVGDGTRKLSQLKRGKKVNIIYPLGKGFTLPQVQDVKSPVSSVKHPLLIGGGCGMAPLLYLAKVLHEKGHEPYVLIGGRTKSQILEIEKFIKYAKVYICTEDGSLAEKGRVLDHPILTKSNFSCIYSCGPHPMMQAVARYAVERNIPCEVSLENTMACGFGACLCCVTPTQEGHKCVCVEGPVFNIDQLKDFI